MYPNPAEALPLAPRPDLEQYKKQAKELLRACKAAEPEALRAWAAQRLDALIRLQAVPLEPRTRAWFERQIEQVANYARRKLARPESALADAQFVLARVHGFTSWPLFARHLAGLARPSSIESGFEAAVDAVVDGDLAALERLLRADPDLGRARSEREHRGTLLHYVAANGVESFRQRTPPNAVAVARRLLAAGAEVDAFNWPEGPAGPGTALGLVATSVHPFRVGVQNALLEVLLDGGAAVDGAPGGWNPLLAALHNGRGEAAAFLATHGARLDLEGAAGAGRLDVVRSFFDADGGLKPPATRAQRLDGFLWACEYGHTSVVDFLLETGVAIAAADGSGMTGLHWAAIGAQLETLRFLVERGAPLEARNGYGGTVLGQAVWSVYNDESGRDHLSVLRALIAAGADVDADPGLAACLERLLGG